ncbi:Histidine phosphatase superfamily, clade-1 [Penicillium expansum]|uniref:Histidine phosphatase superfamily, clade-1 n=1 Tax=Penicillium expansum TaxID=27334 RepID=A0A0A2L6T4_PENEN|nr:Histidine phosphatase superfamily, clade-1 [Penicillium expansum]KGO48579.1 Histidine phosphatase superfamily, clade-1 [Penicillium expansum]KGO55485.1 Histidine phosphatase superfamily, clade-1 [Penicillium expansum]KGO72335.1 Histidine phosphatase superfamily, clade-1 [Penicillium expansum]
MQGRIHLARHAEGLHNLRNDPTSPNASLSERGFDFAEDLGHRFIREYSNNVGAIISSPLRRAIQTSLTAFRRILNSTQYPKNSVVGVINGVMLALDTNLQEITDLSSNNGSTLDDLTTEFPEHKSEI